MISIVLYMMGGIVLGLSLRRWEVRWIDKAITFVIWVLLFELGVEVGGNREIVGALPTLGLSAFEIALAAVLGSSLAAMLLAQWVGIKSCRAVETVALDGQTSENKPKGNPLKGSLIILAFFIAGSLLGFFTQLDTDTYYLKDISFYTLVLLILMVGFTIGHNRDVLSNLKSLDKRLLLLPLFTIFGTLATATALVGLAIPFDLSDTLAVASGQAYYSLSSVMISQVKGAELGTIALIANILRELMALLAAPLLARIFGPLAPISAGGATTADTTLPIIRQVSGDRYSVLSIYHGFVVDFSVPFMVTFFLSI